MNSTLMVCKTVLHLHNKWIRIMLIVSGIILISLIFLPEEIKIKKDLTKDIPLIIKQVDSLETNKTIYILDTLQNRQTFDKLTKNTSPIKIEIVPSKKFDWKGVTTFIISAINGIIIFILNIKKLVTKKLRLKEIINK